MRERTTRTLFNYWNDVRASRLAPRRFEIEPSRIASILSETFILERLARDDYRFRLAGTRICEQFGREFRGQNFLAGWSDEDRLTLQRLLSGVTGEGSVGIADFSATTLSKRQLRFELLILPLLHSGDEVSRVLGCICCAEGDHWVGPDPISDIRLGTNNLIWPDGRPHAVLQAALQNAQLTSQIRQAHIVRSSGRSFRVYEGGRR